MEIVKAQESHIPAIVNLWDEFARYHEPFDPRYPMKDDSRAGYEVHLRELMETENTTVLVAIDRNIVLGYAIAQIRKSQPPWKRERYGSIVEMAVTARHRRHGMGSQLLKEILLWFKSEKLDFVELTVAAKNTLGYSFWKKHGFKDYIHHLFLKP